MSNKSIAYAFFGVGVLLLEIQTTLPVLWGVLGLPGAYPLLGSAVMYVASGFTPVLGVLMLFFAGLVNGRPGQSETR